MAQLSQPQEQLFPDFLSFLSERIIQTITAASITITATVPMLAESHDIKSPYFAIIFFEESLVASLYGLNSM